MKKENKKIIKSALGWLYLVLVLWLSATMLINAFKNPKKTNTELFLDIPKSFILNFN